MANTNAPYGLRPSRHLTGGVTRTTEYPISGSYTTKIYLGDPVGLSSGNVIIGTNAGTAHVGVFAGVKYINAKGEKVFSKYWTGESGATEIKALVYDDPAQIFAIEATTFAAANLGVGYDLAIAAGVTTIGLSKTVINVAATTGAAYKILGLINRDDNESGDYAEVEVIAVKHALASS